MKNSIFLFILWAVSVEICSVSTLSSAATSALLSPFPRTVLMIPTHFLLKHAHRDALRLCPRAQLRAAPCALAGSGVPLHTGVGHSRRAEWDVPGELLEANTQLCTAARGHLPRVLITEEECV